MPESEAYAEPAIVYPRGDLSGRLGRISAALLPLSWLYAAGSGAVRRVQQLDAKRVAGLPWVISVGNIEVGGSGKTPFAIRLLEHIQERNGRAVYVSRGYGSRAARGEGVTVVVPKGSVPSPLPGVRLVRRNDPGLADEIGDEGAVVARRAPGVPLLLGSNKKQSLIIAARMFAPTHAVLDDAFQSWRVYRDRDVVLVGDGSIDLRTRLLPAGCLRESIGALARAHVVLCNHSGEHGQLDRDLLRLQRFAATDALLAGVRKRLSFPDEPPGDPIAAVSGIGQPSGFDRALIEQGIDVRVSIRFPDHYRYRADDLATMERIAREHGATRLVTTEKDAVKINAFGEGDMPREVTLLHVELSDEAVLEKLVEPRHEATAPR